MMATIDPRTPVLAGWAAVSQRESDPLAACEPLALMIEATRRSAVGQDALLAGIDHVSVPRGRWRYRNPGGAIARAVGASRARSVLAHVGILQQSLIGEACRLIQEGAIETALVVGGDCGYRLQRARAAGLRVEDTQQSDDPDLVMTAEEDLLHPAELKAGLQMAVGSYALLHSAFQAARPGGVDQYRDRIARLSSDLSRIAADNPDSWKRDVLVAQAIREPSPRNAMQAFPYTKLHCTNWSVDQAGALILCSAGRADELGIDLGRCVFPIASAASNHMSQVSTRRELGRCLGARLAGQAALAAADLTIDEVDLIDLYSCFPAAVEIVAHELGASTDRPLSVTGGMAMAGGPFNNAVIQATCRMADLLSLRASEGVPPGHRATGLVGSLSGIMTKQGFGLWASRPVGDFAMIDVTAEVAQAERQLEVVDDYSGPAQVAASTVLYERGEPLKAVVIAATPDGRRIVAESADAAVIAALERDLAIGTTIDVGDGSTFRMAS